MLDDLAWYLGMSILIAGGIAFSATAIVLMAWMTFEVVARRVGWVKMVLEWRAAAVRERQAR
jgi:hypothetical protein